MRKGGDNPRGCLRAALLAQRKTAEASQHNVLTSFGDDLFHEVADNHLSSFTHGCIINTCPLNSFFSLPLMTSSRLSWGTRAIEGSSRIALRACSTTSAGTSS